MAHEVNPVVPEYCLGCSIGSCLASTKPTDGSLNAATMRQMARGSGTTSGFEKMM